MSDSDLLSHTKEDFEELYYYLAEEKHIKTVYDSLNDVEKEQANRRLYFISLVRKNFLPEIINIIDEILKDYADKDEIEKNLKGAKRRVREVNKCYRQIVKKHEDIKEDFNFWAWLITFMITKEILLNGSLKATAIYETLKWLFNDNEEKTEYEYYETTTTKFKP